MPLQALELDLIFNKSFTFVHVFRLIFKKNLGKESKYDATTMLDSLPVPTRPAQTSLRLGLPRGFLNEMDVLAPRRRITLEARLVSCWPSLLRCPPLLLFIRRLPTLQHGGVQLPALSNSLESSSPQRSPSEPPSSIQVSFKTFKHNRQATQRFPHDARSKSQI